VTNNPYDPATDDGSSLITVAWAGTVLFVVTATIAVFVEPFRLVSAGVALLLFALGIVGMLMAFAGAVERSRTEDIGMGGLYFLAGSAPKDVQRHLMGATAVQTVVALTTASIRPFTALAFGILVPMFGLGVAGLWAARHGEFPKRQKLVHKKSASTSGKNRKGKRP